MHPYLKLERSTRQELEKAIDRYVEIVSQGCAFDDETIESRMREQGFRSGLVRQVIRFVPIAFGRRMSLDLPVRFSKKYRQYDEFRREETIHELSECECFCVAFEISERYFENEKSWLVARSIGRNSSEYQFVRLKMAEQLAVEKLERIDVPPAVVHVGKPSLLPPYPALLRFEQQCHDWLSKWSDDAP